MRQNHHSTSAQWFVACRVGKGRLVRWLLLAVLTHPTLLSAQTDASQSGEIEAQSGPQLDLHDSLEGSTEQLAVDPEGELITVRDALRRAAANSEEVARAAISYYSARERESLECSALWPTLVASASAVRNDEEVGFGDQVVVNLVDTAARIQFNADIFRGGTIPSCQAAGRTTEAAHYQRYVQERSHLFAVAQAYFAALASQRQHEIALTARDLAQEQVEAAEIRRQVSVTPASDVSRAQLELSRAEQEVYRTSIAIEDGLDALAFLTGDTPNPNWILEDPGDRVMTFLTEQPVSERPEVLAARLMERSASLRHRAAWWELIPTISLSAVTNFRSGSFSDPDGISWSISLLAAWTIFDGGGRYARIDLTALTEETTRLDTQELERRLGFDEVGASRRLEAAEVALDLSEQTLLLAQQTYDDASTLYQLGFATGLEVAESLSELIRSQAGVNIATLERNLAEIEWGFRSGRLWPDGIDSLQ